MGATRGKEKLQSLRDMYIIILKTRRNKHRICGRPQKKRGGKFHRKDLTRETTV